MDNLKKKRIRWCPVCENEMISLYELIDHVKQDKCGMTLERLKAVGVLDDWEIEGS
jgi:hypothetical protein